MTRQIIRDGGNSEEDTGDRRDINDYDIPNEYNTVAPMQLHFNYNEDDFNRTGGSVAGNYYRSSSRRDDIDDIPVPLPPPYQPTFYVHDDVDNDFKTKNNLQEQSDYKRLSGFKGDRKTSYVASSSNLASSYGRSYPYKRCREETAAMEGLVTAAISQLESIVCRVLVLPGGKTDPITLTVGNDAYEEKEENGADFREIVDDNDGGLGSSSGNFHECRLTPNSRNIHQRWIPLAPGLGIAGLAYLEWQRLQQDIPPKLDDCDDDDGGVEDLDDDETLTQYEETVQGEADGQSRQDSGNNGIPLEMDHRRFEYG